MVGTRSQTKGQAPKPKSAANISARRDNHKAKHTKQKQAKQKRSNKSQDAEQREPPKHEADHDASQEPHTDHESRKRTLERLITKYGATPLSDLEGLDNKSKTVMAHIFNAMLSSGRISHEIAHRSLLCVVNAGYIDLSTLHKSSWEERTKVLTEGGYTHYREKTATAFGDLANLIKNKYGNDASNLIAIKKGEDARATLTARLNEIKQIGKVGVEIFLASSQGLCSGIAPFLDSRSAKTAQDLGLGDGLETLFELVNRDPEQMATLNAALTKVRLEKRESEFN